MSLKKLLCNLMLFFLILPLKATEVIRINQLGYLPHSVKVAVFLSTEKREISKFSVYDALTNKIVFKGETQVKNAKQWGMKTSYRLNLSALVNEGK